VKEFRDQPGHKWEQFKAAIDYCKRHRCLLVIPRIGKRPANLPMLELLAESDIEFETPGLTRAGLPQRLVEERERRDKQAERHSMTMKGKAALGEKIGFAKQQPAKRGKGDPIKGSAVAAERRAERTRKYYENIVKALHVAREKYPGATNQLLADKLNEYHFPTTSGKPFTATAVLRILKRYPAK
jgi:hypothetical protein